MLAWLEVQDAQLGSQPGVPAAAAGCAARRSADRPAHGTLCPGPPLLPSRQAARHLVEWRDSREAQMLVVNLAERLVSLLAAWGLCGCASLASSGRRAALVRWRSAGAR